MNAVSEIEPTAGTASSTPGELLRQEREARGLTVQQVSEELHLDTWLIDALEENRFLALGAPVYAKGHLRKYAVLLGLSPELILARYQVIAEPPPPIQLPAREALLTPEPIARRFDWRRFQLPSIAIDWRSFDWRSYGIIGGLLLAAGGLWLLSSSMQSSSDPKPVAAKVAPTQASTPPSVPASVSTQPPTVATTVQPSPPSIAPAVAPTVQPTTTPTRPVSTPLQSNARNVATPSIAPATAPAIQQPKPAPPAAAPARLAVAPTTVPIPGRKPEAPVAAVNSPASLPKPLATPAPAQVATATVPAPASEIPQVSLRLEFAIASWAEVYDGEGRRLLYAVGDPNKPRTVSGKPPLKVTLGMAGSVQARVNGRPIAIPRRIGQDSASFTVGANGAIR